MPDAHAFTRCSRYFRHWPTVGKTPCWSDRQNHLSPLMRKTLKTYLSSETRGGSNRPDALDHLPRCRTHVVLALLPTEREALARTASRPVVQVPRFASTRERLSKTGSATGGIVSWTPPRRRSSRAASRPRNAVPCHVGPNLNSRLGRSGNGFRKAPCLAARLTPIRAPHMISSLRRSGGNFSAKE